MKDRIDGAADMKVFFDSDGARVLLLCDLGEHSFPISARLLTEPREIGIEGLRFNRQVPATTFSMMDCIHEGR